MQQYRCIHTALTQMSTIGCEPAHLAFRGACQMIMSSTTTVATYDIPWIRLHPTVCKILQAIALLQNLSQCLHGLYVDCPVWLYSNTSTHLKYVFVRRSLCFYIYVVACMLPQKLSHMTVHRMNVWLHPGTPVECVKFDNPYFVYCLKFKNPTLPLQLELPSSSLPTTIALQQPSRKLQWAT